MIPAWLLTIRELVPASDAAWLMPILLLFSGSGMPAGGWLAGLLYDRFGFYEAAFLAGLICNRQSAAGRPLGRALQRRPLTVWA
jgi:hypothetical protein